MAQGHKKSSNPKCQIFITVLLSCFGAVSHAWATFICSLIWKHCKNNVSVTLFSLSKKKAGHSHSFTISPQLRQRMSLFTENKHTVSHCWQKLTPFQRQTAVLPKGQWWCKVLLLTATEPGAASGSNWKCPLSLCQMDVVSNESINFYLLGTRSRPEAFQSAFCTTKKNDSFRGSRKWH